MNAPTQAHLRVRRQANYLRGITQIGLSDDYDEAQDDQAADTPEEALGGYASVHVLAAVFDLPTELVVEDVVRFRAIYDEGRS